MSNIAFRSLVHTGCVLAIAITIAPGAFAPAQAADVDVGSIHVTEPWARATPKGATTAAAYMTITNKGKTPDKVSCVSSDASATCQIHTMSIDNNGVMKMRPVEGGLEINPGETLTLRPGSFHVMMENLKHPLAAGDTVKLTLKFDNAGTVEVAYPVAAIGAAAPGVPAGGGMMQGGGMMGPQGGGMSGPPGGMMGPPPSKP
jgi:copper(I)-binding protein